MADLRTDANGLQKLHVRVPEVLLQAIEANRLKFGSAFKPKIRFNPNGQACIYIPSGTGEDQNFTISVTDEVVNDPSVNVPCGLLTSAQNATSKENDPTFGAKRPCDTNDEGVMPRCKKPRISHYQKNNRSNGTPNVQQKAAPKDMPSSKTPRNPKNNVEVNSLEEDFAAKYTAISSVEQRRQYKKEFDDDFKEYLRLQESINRIKKKFAQLEEDLRRERHLGQVKQIQQKILREYRNVGFTVKAERLTYLHKKLGFIKRLVKDYDAISM
ncbi:RNA polymerase II elongation factor ELL-like [Sabethes cyaneus]|uniref:RNA polymerase II elongation factor ELL-like n=1 Tax=Sabethes cyaneus TaxID=53552 RepID=UPI00237EAA7E|nr:RNA polymerase II elongation factor ELL-like [Sabethes cyaneus]